MNFKPMALALAGLAGLANAGEVIKSGPSTPGGAAAQMVPGKGFACPSPKRWEMVRGVTTCKEPDPPIEPPIIKDPPQSAVCKVGTEFEIQYTVDRVEGQWPPKLDMWVQYRTGGFGKPAFLADVYAFPTFYKDYTNSYPIPPDADGVYRTGYLSLAQTISSGSIGLVNATPPAIQGSSAASSYVASYFVTRAKCVNGALTEIYFYGCNNCDNG